MPEITLELSPDGLVGWITIDNQSKLNAMSLSMWKQLDTVVGEVESGPRCVVVRGAGGRAFVSGADISEFGGLRRAPVDVAAYDDAALNAMERLHDLEVPTVAMISGYCFGGGVSLAMSCDVRIADEKSIFSVPAARLGLGYGWRGVAHLLEAVSPAVATDIMVSARRLDAREALAAGLISQLFPAEDLTSKVTAYAESVAANAPLTVRAAKRIIREMSGHRPPDFELCKRLVAECFASDDYLEGAEAFMQKRAPRFEGR